MNYEAENNCAECSTNDPCGRLVRVSATTHRHLCRACDPDDPLDSWDAYWSTRAETHG